MTYQDPFGPPPERITPRRILENGYVQPSDAYGVPERDSSTDFPDDYSDPRFTFPSAAYHGVLGVLGTGFAVLGMFPERINGYLLVSGGFLLPAVWYLVSRLVLDQNKRTVYGWVPVYAVTAVIFIAAAVKLFPEEIYNATSYFRH